MLKFHSLIFLFTAVLISSCGVQSSKSPAASAPVNTNAPSSGSGSSNGSIVNSAGFFAELTNDELEDSTVLHIADAAYGSDVGTTNFSSECKVPYGTTGAAADIFCILEIEELDLYFNDLVIQVHVPSDMCSYLKVKPYSFYRFEAHDGPGTVHYQNNADGSITDISNSSNGVPVCNYDYSANGYGNCCTGNYSLVVDTIDSSGNTTTNTTTGEWGGHAGNCVTGPATSTQTIDTTYKTPINSIYYVDGVGFNRTYTIPKAINTYQTNIWASNFYNPSDHAASKPEAMTAPSAAEIADANERYLPNDTYSWECLDRAEDLLGRIRIMIREWNTDVLAQGGNPDVTGADPIDATQPLNDRNDWLDWGDVYPTSAM